MSKIFDSVIIYGSGTTNSSTLETLNGNKINTFTIKDNGNVGIGTSTPTEKLEVSGKTKSTLLQMTSGATEGYLLTALDNQGNIAWKPFNNEDITELAPVISIQSTPPISNIDGDRYLISGGTGIWSGKTNLISEWLNPNWLYTTGVTDNTVFVTDTLTTVRYNGSNWVPYRGTAILQNGNKLNTSVNIGSNDNNDVNFRSSGTTRMTIKNNGNVGIGTSSPTAKLHVVGNASTGDTVNPLIVKGIYDNTFLISNQNAYANPNRMGVYSTIYDNRFNIDLAGSAGQFRLNYGNSKFWMNPYPMAFGTTFLFASNPSGGSGESGIEHTVNCLGSYNIGEILNIGCDGSSTGVTYFGKYIRKSNFNNPNATFYPLIALDGNVGFGTNTPTASLHLINTTTGHTFIAQDSNPDSTPFVIDNDGKVGIGTVTPTEKLNVSGRTYITESLGVGVSPVNQGIILGSTQPIFFGVTNHYIYNSGDALFVNGWSHLVLNATQDLVFKTNNIGSFFVDTNQNIGVNLTGTTTDSSKLQIRGSDSTSSNYGLKVQDSGGTNNLVVRNDGNVGIGTATPTSKLQVIGSITTNTEDTYLSLDASNRARLGFVKKNGQLPAVAVGSTSDFRIAKSSNIDISNVSGSNFSDMFIITPGVINLFDILGEVGISSKLRVGSTVTPVSSNIFQVDGNSFIDGDLGIGISTPDNSAILQVDSTTKGFLPPRMTASQAEAISNPSEGLMVYITGGTGSVITSKGWWGTTGTTSADWVKIGP